MIHVVFDGTSKDLEFDDVFKSENFSAIGISEGATVSPNDVTKEQIKNALCHYLDISDSELSDHYIEINKNGNITVRPEATFG